MGGEMSEAKCFSADGLERWASSVFQALDVEKAAADKTARVLVRTNLRGIDTHGINRVPVYVEKLRSGELNGRAAIDISWNDGVLFVDGDGGMGQAVGSSAVTEAVHRATGTGVVTCFIRRSGHLGAIGQYTLQAAEQGMVAFICQETPPLMAMEGSTRPSIGNNPIAFSCPVKGREPLTFDMATSVVARGNVVQAIADDASAIPDGWAIGPDGRPTNDPRLALKGAMLPVAGHKGIGLAMLVQVLAGSLTGSMTTKSAAAHGATGSAGNVSGFLMVVNPDRVIGRDLFDAHVVEWLSTYLAATGERGRYPGQRAAESESRRMASGIPIADSTLELLAKAGESVGVPFDAAAV